MEYKKLLKRVVTNKSKKDNLLKVLEELNELSTIILQQINKEDKNFDIQILTEVADVEIQIEAIKLMIDNGNSYKTIKEGQVDKFYKLYIEPVI